MIQENQIHISIYKQYQSELEVMKIIRIKIIKAKLKKNKERNQIIYI